MITLPKYTEVSIDYNIGLCFVIDADGNIIYSGPNYFVFASDITGDGKIDISDVNCMINVMLGYDVPTGNQGHDTMPSDASIKLSDVTGDGQVDISDVNAVINAMLGKY